MTPRQSTAIRYVALAAILVVFAGLVRFASFSLNEPKLTIAIHQGVEGVALRKIAAEFSRNEKISVEVVDWPYDQLFEVERDYLRGNDPPVSPRYDVIMLDDPWLPALIHNPASDSPTLQVLFGGNESNGLPLFNPAEKDELDIDDFVEPTLHVCQHPYKKDKTGVFYALPFVGNSQLFCYLTEDFPSQGKTPRKVPTTWKAVFEEGERLRTKPHRTYGYITRVGRGNSIVTDFMPILWGADPTSLSESELNKIDPAKAWTAFKFLEDLGKRGQPDFSMVASDDFDLAVHFAKHNASMGIIWSAWAMAIARAGLIEDLSYSPMPSEQPALGQPALGHPALGAWLLAVPAKSAHKEEARKFLKFATSKAVLKSAAQEGNPPPRKSTFADPCLNEDFPSFKKQKESLSNSRPRTRTRYWRELEKEMGECLSDLYANAIGVDEAMSRVNCVIAKYRNEASLPDGPKSNQPDCTLLRGAIGSPRRSSIENAK